MHSRCHGVSQDNVRLRLRTLMCPADWTARRYRARCGWSEGKSLRRGLSQFAMDLGPVRLHEFKHATAGDHVCAKLVEDLGDLPYKTLLMRNHGCMTVGRTVGECYFRLFQLIRACDVQCACAPIMEDAVVVPDETIAATFAIAE